MATPRTEKRVRFNLDSGSSSPEPPLSTDPAAYPSQTTFGTTAASAQPGDLQATIRALDARLPLAGKSAAPRGLLAAASGVYALVTRS